MARTASGPLLAILAGASALLPGPAAAQAPLPDQGPEPPACHLSAGGDEILGPGGSLPTKLLGIEGRIVDLRCEGAWLFLLTTAEYVEGTFFSLEGALHGGATRSVSVPTQPHGWLLVGRILAAHAYVGIFGDGMLRVIRIKDSSASADVLPVQPASPAPPRPIPSAKEAVDVRAGPVLAGEQRNEVQSLDEISVVHFRKTPILEVLAPDVFLVLLPSTRDGQFIHLGETSWMVERFQLDATPGPATTISRAGRTVEILYGKHTHQRITIPDTIPVGEWWPCVAVRRKLLPATARALPPSSAEGPAR